MFDPYRKWLGILPKDQPPNFYRLLSLELYENDMDVIESAVDRTMGFIRQYQSGEHATHAANLLNEIARARLCLLKPKSKAEYDAKLRSEIGSTQEPVREKAAPEIDWPSVELPTSPRRPVASKRKKSKKNSSAPIQWILGGAVAVLVLIVALLLSRPNENRSLSKSNENTLPRKPEGNAPASSEAKLPAEENKTDTQTASAASASVAPSSAPEQVKQDAVAETKKEITEETKQDAVVLTKKDGERADAVVPTTPSPPAETTSPPDPTKIKNLVSLGDMEFPGAQFKKTFTHVTPDHKPFAINRWEQNPHSGKACLRITGRYEWACLKIAKFEIPYGKTIHGSMWRRAERGTGNFLIIGLKDNVGVMYKEIYGGCGKEWEETHWAFTSEELKNATQLDIQLTTSKDFDVYFDDICVWAE